MTDAPPKRLLRVLIVSYGYPPSQAIGYIRVGKLSKYLARNGCDVRVITSHPDCLPFPSLLRVELPDEHIVRVRFGREQRKQAAGSTSAARLWRSRLGRAMRRIGRHVPRPNFSRLPDIAMRWYGPAERAGRTLIEGWRPDVLFSSSGPAGSHVVASRLARRYSLPWVADFRDLWTNNPVVIYPPWLDALERQYERAVLRAATHLVTVSEPLAEELRLIHGKPVSVVCNGYDPEDFLGSPADTPEFVLTYTGQLNPGTHDPTSLLRAIAALDAQGAISPTTFRLRLIGRVGYDYIDTLAEQHGVQAYIDTTGVIAHTEAIRHQQSASALLLINIVAPRGSNGIISGKLPEYLGARRPILAIGPEDRSVSALLRTTGTGQWAATPADIADILERWISRRGPPEASMTDTGAIAAYSRAEQGRVLAGILQDAHTDRA
jgi:glycosyltransferase involved in cell wall biosynthesis